MHILNEDVNLRLKKGKKSPLCPNEFLVFKKEVLKRVGSKNEQTGFSKMFRILSFSQKPVLKLVKQLYFIDIR